jgi:hypothetical protein
MTTEREFMKLKSWLAAVLLASLSLNAHALEEIVGKVNFVEASYMPVAITFQLSGTSSASCPPGTVFTWGKSDMSNNKAVYASLIAAMMAGTSVRIYVDPANTGCAPQFIHFLGA